jgi:hypothetical protein
VDSVADPNKVLRSVLTLAAVSTIMPGLGHLLVGRERSGRMIFKAYLCLLALGGLLLVVALLSKRLLLELAVRPGALRLLEYGAVVVAIAWCLVIIAAPSRRPRRLDQCGGGSPESWCSRFALSSRCRSSSRPDMRRPSVA